MEIVGYHVLKKMAILEWEASPIMGILGGISPRNFSHKHWTGKTGGMGCMAAQQWDMNGLGLMAYE